MKSYVITIMDLPKSVQYAQRCIDSMPEFNIEMFPAVTPKNNPIAMLRTKGIDARSFNEKYSNLENCAAAFLSHHTLWEMCANDNEEYQIFEHDAVCVGNLPKFISYNGCISLGAPSYGKYNTPTTLGVNPLVSKRYLPGAHAYRLKPKAARQFVEIAKEHAKPTDVFLNKDLFPWLQEYYPWPVVAKDSFTTIQNVSGCTAKHNYGDTYEILDVK